MHTPVLLKEVIESLNIKKEGLYIDATAGEGGHLEEIAKNSSKVLGIDQDANQIKNLELRFKNFSNIKLVLGNFSGIERIAKENKFFPADGILLDLGLSMNQIKSSGKGFSFRQPGEPLDMRFDTAQEATAADIVNNSSQSELYEIFSRYSEEINSLEISKSVVRARSLKKIETVADLIDAINKVTNDEKNKVYARIFQALRIAVNDELENLKKGLNGSLNILNNEGRIAVISFHSLENRIVKKFISDRKLKQINKKIIRSEHNAGFERSAKLRIITG